MKKFKVCYKVNLSNIYEIEAKDELEAVAICEQMVQEGEIGNLNEMDVTDQDFGIA